jgi:hypothetical protein
MRDPEKKAEQNNAAEAPQQVAFCTSTATPPWTGQTIDAMKLRAPDVPKPTIVRLGFKCVGLVLFNAG